MKKVYFFGAGASKASIFEFPTMRGFFRGEDLKLQQYDQLRDLIYELFPNTPVDELNLEEMVSHLDLTLDDLGKRGLVEGIDSFQAQTQLMDTSDLMRRLVKEQLLKFDGKRLISDHVRNDVTDSHFHGRCHNPR